MGIIYAEFETNEVEAFHKNTFRTNFFLRTVKHRFEARYISGCISRHIGFSPTSSERTFISFTLNSYWDYLYFLEYLNQSSQSRSGYYNYNFSSFDTLMVCLDVLNSKFITVFLNQTLEYTISHINDTKTWYGMIDTTSSCTQSNPSIVEVNLGRKSFSNNIPNGFSPLINAIYKSVTKNYRLRCSYAHPKSLMVFFHVSLI
jgi:hypothetical protein